MPSDKDAFHAVAGQGRPRPKEPPEAQDVELYCLQVTLKDAHVPTWRRLLVPSEYPLEELHAAITLLFDWSGAHLFFFQAGDVFYDDELIGLAPREGERRSTCAGHVVKELLPEVGATARYVYDLGDCWEMDLEVEGRLTGADYPFPQVPVCVGGEGGNPPEDVGGVGGYEDLCAVLARGAGRDYREACEWLGVESGKDLDPTFFDLEWTNYLLALDEADAFEEELIPKDPRELVDMLKDYIAADAARCTTELLAGMARPDPALAPQADEASAGRGAQGAGALLAEFEQELEEKGFSEKTIDKHVANAELFVRRYLADRGLTLAEGCRSLDDFFGYYFPREHRSPTTTALKDCVVSVKRFYRVMQRNGHVQAADVAFLEETIRDFQGDWVSSIQGRGGTWA